MNALIYEMACPNHKARIGTVRRDLNGAARMAAKYPPGTYHHDIAIERLEQRKKDMKWVEENMNDCPKCGR